MITVFTNYLKLYMVNLKTFTIFYMVYISILYMNQCCKIY